MEIKKLLALILPSKKYQSLENDRHYLAAPCEEYCYRFEQASYTYLKVIR